MISTLYDCFKHWSKSGSVYIISDTHFMDKDMNWRWNLINDYPFAVLDIVDSDEDIARRISDYLVWKINKKAHKNDTLIILGDVGDIEYVKQLKAGHKVLIKGNHDSGSKKYHRNFYIGYVGLEPRWSDNYLFDEVYEGPLFIADRILLSHEPLKAEIGCYFNIHGHSHGDEDEYIDDLLGIKRQEYFMNTCCEKIGFEPVNLGILIKQGLVSNVKDIHRHTIDKASNKT